MLPPSCIVSGLSGGSGKTMVSLGLARAFLRQGYSVKTFKKGPDYIDAVWLALAARSPQGNLDPFFSSAVQVRQLFHAGSAGYDFALIEGNRGLFDGLDIAGSCSTAEVARILQIPVILVVDCTKMTRTVAALINGCANFEPGVTLGGVILNRTGNSRHQALVQQAVEELTPVPVLGVLPRRELSFISERHMGLTGTHEHMQAESLLDSLADFLSEHVDLAKVHALAAAAFSPTDNTETATANPIPLSKESLAAGAPPEATPTELLKDAAISPLPQHSARPRIGFVRDAALWFYYQENLDALHKAGAELVELSLLSRKSWPRLDGLYLGGGVPELHAKALSANLYCRQMVQALGLDGLPLYAECGGLMYLAEELQLEAGRFPMAGLLPIQIAWCNRPQGLGYSAGEVVAENPFHPVGSHFRGHEFHFSHIIPAAQASTHVFRLSRGKGMGSVGGTAMDGITLNNTFASYTHIYAPALPHWAPRFVALCQGKDTTRGPAFP